MILYTEDPIRCYHKTTRAHQSIGNTAGYKINTHKSAAFLYTNNERSERKIQETIPFTIPSKTIKYLGISLPKKTKDLCSENYKTDERS